jgi:hypothetical protein
MPIDGDFVKMMGFLFSQIFMLGLYCTFGSNLMAQVSATHQSLEAYGI